MTTPMLAPEETSTGDDDGLVHLVCDCDDNRSLCGLELAEDGWWPGPVPPELRCVVCFDLSFALCGRCGA
jgi:hypothetical protein